MDDAFSVYGGSFLFAPAAPVFADKAQADAFVILVQNWLVPGNSFVGRYCVWIPQAGPAPVFGTSSFTNPDGGFYAFRFSQQLAGYSLQTNFNSIAGLNMSLSVAQGVFISVRDGGLGLFGPQAPGITYQTPTALQLSVNANQALIPLGGNSAGCFVLSGVMSIAEQLNGLLAGLQYAYRPLNSQFDKIQSFPVLNVSGSPSFNYLAAFDPLDPYGSGAASSARDGRYRTILSISSTASPVSLPTFFRSASNQPVAFVAQSAGDAVNGPAAYDAGFVFQPLTPLATGGNGLPVATNIYLAPAGDYQSALTESGVAVSLLCGLAGSETILLQPAGTTAPDKIRFTPSSPAYTPQFPPPPVDLTNPATGIPTPPLPATAAVRYLTSWAEIVAGSTTAPTYSAQPEGNALFGPGGAFSSGAALANGGTIAGALRPATNVIPVSFPIVPWAGAAVMPGGIPAASWSDYESKVLSTTRRNALLGPLTRANIKALKAGRTAVQPGQVEANGTTPQGLLAQMHTANGHTVYDAIVLAQSGDSGTSESQMAFFDVDAPLQGLFQTNQLFAVITNPANLGTFQNTVDIAGWKMQANVGVASASSNVSNVLILKFCTGTVQELAGKPDAWVDPADFSAVDASGSVAVLSQALSTYISGAIGFANRGNTLYQNFANIVTNPGWQGILVLGADIAPTDLPPQLAGLAGGINFSNFRAHHFGVTVSPVSFDSASKTFQIPGTSSLFGLVDYQLPAFAQSVAGNAPPTLPLALPVTGAYDFTVLQLQSLFENSALTDFRSHVQVTTNVLFGSKVSASYANLTRQAANAVVLTGYYQDQGGQGTYLFESDAPVVMLLDSNVLNAVILTKIIFNTLTANDQGTPPSILSRILIWGSLDFSILAGAGSTSFDLMSYGMPANSAPEAANGGLAFSNLHIDMSSPVATPNITAYNIVETNIAFDLAGSLLRKSSLVTGLALQPQSLIVAPSGTTTAARGYLPVRLDQGAPPQTAVTTAWYGISCLINMGGPGALASAAGFNSTLLIAWSPQSSRGAKAYAAFAGLQLPGASPGASAFSLQGVINLKVETISLSLAPVAGQSGDAFTLRLSNIALSFLGLAKLPSGASIDLFLFGAPDGAGSLGWYAAYVEDTKVTNLPAGGTTAA